MVHHINTLRTLKKSIVPLNLPPPLRGGGQGEVRYPNIRNIRGVSEYIKVNNHPHPYPPPSRGRRTGLNPCKIHFCRGLTLRTRLLRRFRSNILTAILPL